MRRTIKLQVIPLRHEILREDSSSHLFGILVLYVSVGNVCDNGSDDEDSIEEDTGASVATLSWASSDLVATSALGSWVASDTL